LDFNNSNIAYLILESNRILLLAPTAAQLYLLNGTPTNLPMTGLSSGVATLRKCYFWGTLIKDEM
jgi:hypothetical protein